MKNSIIFLVFKKEIKDLFRDRRTIISSILIPLIMFPILFGVMGNGIKSVQKKAEKNIKLIIQDEGDSELTRFIKRQKNIEVISSKDSMQDVRSGRASIAVIIPKSFKSDIINENQSKVQVIYDNSSENSQMAFQIVSTYVDAYSKQIVSERLNKRKIDVNILNPIEVSKTTITNENEGASKLMISMLLPLMLVLYSVIGPMAPAIDLGVGEKERGTLEPLLTTQASRMSILWGKFFAITLMGVITTAASILGIIIATLVVVKNDGVFNGMSKMSYGISMKSMILVGLIIVITTMIFGAFELSISVFAKSTKEAQTYISPLMLLAFIPVYAVYMVDAKNIEFMYFNIPLANVVCLIKEFINGIYNYSHIFTTFAWSIIYIIIAIMLARFMFNREDVIFRT